jgi:hypothetical protein
MKTRTNLDSPRQTRVLASFSYQNTIADVMQFGYAATLP